MFKKILLLAAVLLASTGAMAANGARTSEIDIACKGNRTANPAVGGQLTLTGCTWNGARLSLAQLPNTVFTWEAGIHHGKGTLTGLGNAGVYIFTITTVER